MPEPSQEQRELLCYPPVGRMQEPGHGSANRRDQYAEESISSPVERVLSFCQTPKGGSPSHHPFEFRVAPTGWPSRGSNGHVSIESLMKRTDPSPKSALTPPGCRLEAAKVCLG